jgi:hypothetical protein
MTTQASEHQATAAVAAGPRPPLALAVAALALAPIVLTVLAARLGAPLLVGHLPVEPTNLEVARKVVATLLHPTSRGDSWLPMEQALRLLHGPAHDRLYEILFFQDHVRFQYPPTSLLWLEGLTALGLGKAYSLNALNSLVFLADAAATGVLAWLLPPRAGAARLALAVLAAGLCIAFYPLTRAHILGQIQLWIDLLFTGAVILWRLDRRLLAGVLIGLACSIKPQLGLLLLWAALWREWRFAAGVLAALAPVGALSLASYGLHNHLAYLQVLSFLSRHGESFFSNNSVNGILNWYLSGEDSLRWNAGGLPAFHPAVYAGTLAATLVFLALVVLPPLLAKDRKAGLGDLAVAAICTVAGSPVAWEHHYGLLLPLFVVALAQLLERPQLNRLRATLLFAAWALVAPFIPFIVLAADTPWAALQANAFFGALLLLGFFLADPAPLLRSEPARFPASKRRLNGRAITPDRIAS